MSNIGKVAYLMVAAGFPIYLLWKGELGAYLALATTAQGNGSGATSPSITLGTAANPTTYSPMGIVSAPASASGLQNIPIPGL